METSQLKSSDATSASGAVAVKRLSVYRVAVPLKKTIKHASHTRTSSDNLVVECQLSDGATGYGEGVPREYVTGETIDSSCEILRRTDWSALLKPFDGFQSAVDALSAFQLEPVEGDDRGCNGNAARCAVELAVLDAFGKSTGVCLRELPAYLPECASVATSRERCRYSGVITSKKVLRERFSAWKQRIFGFKQIKIKVGTDGQDDVSRLKNFRRIFGAKIDLRIDANEAWSVDEAVGRIRELEQFGVTSVEQPVRHEEVDGLAEVRQQVNTPIMHDESLCSMADARQAVQRQTCDLFNIRLSKCGGLIPSMQLAAFAHKHGLGYQLGCQVGETGVLSAAGRHFACSIKNVRYLEGSYDDHLVAERLTRENLTFGWGGVARALTGAGLGVHVHPERLQRIAGAKVVLYG